MRRKKRGYRAVVIDGRIAVRFLAAILTFAVIFAIAYVNINLAGKRLDFHSDKAAQAIIEDTIPAAAADNPESFFAKCAAKIRKGFCFLLTFDYSNLHTIFFSEIPLTRAVNDSALITMARNSETAPDKPAAASAQPSATPLPEELRHIKSIDSSQTKALGNSDSKILLNNQTTYSIDINEMLNAPLGIDMSQAGPKILILHTHATEAFSPDGAETYAVGTSDRSQDTTQNVVRVGAEMAQVFQENGIEVLHDKKLHDYPSYNGSYENSLATAQWYTNRYPSIQMVLDVHRDAIVYDDGTKAKVVTEINGKRASQVMLVVGTDYSGLTHPNWRKNMQLAVQLQRYTVQKYPYLMRSVNLRKERFNGHTTNGSMILEIGTSGNSLEESVYSGRLMAECISGFLKGL